MTLRVIKPSIVLGIAYYEFLPYPILIWLNSAR